MSKPPSEIAFDRMVLDAVGELACVGEADLRLASDLQIGTRLDQGSVTRERHTSNAERSARAHKLQSCCRVHDPEGVLPGPLTRAG